MATELVAVRFNNVTYSTTSKITSYKPYKDEEEDVSSCWMTLGTEEDTLI
jgi:hypothetical protein